MKNYYKYYALVLLICSFCVSFSIRSQPIIELDKTPAVTAGKYSLYFQESEQSKLSLAEAMEQFASTSPATGYSESISLGISVAPVWLKTRLLNASQGTDSFRISTETPWLDYIDAWIVHDGEVIEHVQGGDGVAFEQRPMPYRYFAFETNLPEGESVLYLRIETVGPMAIPLRISTTELAVKRDISSAYQYGFLYGIMLALALYNLILYFSVRLPEYGLYALYLIGFVVNSLSYTGQLHAWITPDFGPYFQDWLDIFLMITYSIAGLHFARLLLHTREYAPLLNKITIGITVVIPLGMLFGALSNNLTLALLLAFLLNTSFAMLFIVMGIQALKNNIAAAWLFLVCSVTAATCICISTSAVAGMLPYNGVTFKLIEIGMAFEAICLAFLLAQRFRSAEADKLAAEKSARIDSLTGLNNRRGFAHIAQPIWHQKIRTGRDISLVLIDIDHFKKINDDYGHAEGDAVLKTVATVLKEGVRKSDILARWGGEEFLLLLTDTAESEALQYAERLRSLIESAEVQCAAGTIRVTASLGVCGTQAGKLDDSLVGENDLESMINTADKALYKVKSAGRNQVSSANLLKTGYC
ncbi:GGDEF domain-containing protein [Alteromonas aestuariivivens]|uniref:diguanylate cyclase n=1 Tax=Alteromonas aestuariivivens TaxID=1938339 RepID=A0A3D8M692_9ALTE|nr:diguanylate cyclase [Alteromonas aestuariivivens]RDV25257.1 GGDEF domain-containing protein [Alteromonas aestuariivivens]